MKRYIFAILLLAAMLFYFSACGGNGQVEQPVQEAIGGIFHQFDNLGFSVEFPAFWEGKYGMAEFYFEQDYGTTYLVAIYHLGSREFGGILLWLGRAVGEHFTYDNPPRPAGGSIFLAQTGGYTYFINFPSDVQHNYLEPDSESAVEYRKMAGPWGEQSHWDFLIDSFRLID
ncbi:MAG: hypothetical protein FWE24_06300 [Defluviitaleaceae bacterium]|nr:hypothetical protein [Defluviitaleaceae bacterium]